MGLLVGLGTLLCVGGDFCEPSCQHVGEGNCIVAELLFGVVLLPRCDECAEAPGCHLLSVGAAKNRLYHCALILRFLLV